MNREAKGLPTVTVVWIPGVKIINMNDFGKLLFSSFVLKFVCYYYFRWTQECLTGYPNTLNSFDEFTIWRLH